MSNDEFYDVIKILFSLNYLIRTKTYYRYIDKFLDSNYLNRSISTRKVINQKNKIGIKDYKGYKGYKDNKEFELKNSNYKNYMDKLKNIFEITGVERNKFKYGKEYKFSPDSLDIIDNLVNIKYKEKTNENELKDQAIEYLKAKYSKKKLQANIEGLKLIINDMRKIIEDNLSGNIAKEQIENLYEKLRYDQKNKTIRIEESLKKTNDDENEKIKNTIKKYGNDS